VGEGAGRRDAARDGLLPLISSQKAAKPGKVPTNTAPLGGKKIPGRETRTIKSVMDMGIFCYRKRSRPQRKTIYQG